MAVDSSRVTLRARLTVAAVSVGAVAMVAVVVMLFGSRIGGVITADSATSGGAISASAGQQNPEELRKEALNKIKGLPLYFEKNQGQVNSSVRYLARSGRYSLFLTDNAAVFSLIGGGKPKGPLPESMTGGADSNAKFTESAVRVRLIGANAHPQVEGLDQLAGRVNYLIGEEKNWHRDIPTFGRVRFDNVYPGVDVVHYGTPDSLEYDLVAAPGADTSKIKFAIEGSGKIAQTATGDILIRTVSGTIRIGKPQSYQQNADGSTTPVEGSFQIAKDGTVVEGIATREVGIKLAAYDHGRQLFIDPTVTATIVYSTYFGGDGSSLGPVNLEQFSAEVNNAPIPEVAESGLDVAIDSSTDRDAYITGSAYSNDLPTMGANSMTPQSSTLEGANSPPSQNPNIYVAKFDTTKSNANSLIYATYIGAEVNTTAAGTGDGDLGFGIAVDGSFDAYVVGQTYSGNANSSGPDFPGTNLCGTWGTTGHNNGHLASTNVGIITELDPNGHSLIYSCYIPGKRNATAARVALIPGCMSNCPAFVVGSTQSTAAMDGFIVTGNALQSELATGEKGLSNGFMLEVAGGGTAAAPVYSTFYGGTANGNAGDAGLGIAAVSTTEVAITGLTFSGASGGATTIPLTANAAQSTFLGGTNETSMAFVAEINPTSGALTYGSYLGGSGNSDFGV